jgi:transcriptional regulator GlxA family with amidase domain
VAQRGCTVRRWSRSPATDCALSSSAARSSSPYAWLVGERIGRAKELLDTTHLKAQEVAARVGLGSAESLRHHFRRRVGTTRAQYRRRFWRAAGQ